MTMFIKENFYPTGEYVNYRHNGNMKFVARFKHAKASKSSFINFLIKNFTVEEYFNRLEGEREAPLSILQSKGYLQPHIKKMLKERGYEVSTAGYHKMIANACAVAAKIHS